MEWTTASSDMLDSVLRNETVNMSSLDLQQHNLGILAKNLTSAPQNDNVGLAIFFLIYTITGVFGNILVLLLICIKEELWKSSYIYMLNVSLADFLLCAICGSFNATIQFSGVQHKACSFMGIVLTMALIASIVSLAAVAINRYLLLRLSAARYNQLYSTARIVVSLIIIWAISIVAVIPLALGYTRTGIDTRIRVCSAVVTDIYSYFYGVGVVLLIGFPCTVTIIVSYTCIWTIFRLSRIRQQRHLQANKQQQHHGGSSRRACQENFRLSRNLFLISATFVFCWLPEMILIVLDYDIHLPSRIHYVTTLLALSHSVVHPILCVTLNSNIAHALRELLTCVDTAKMPHENVKNHQEAERKMLHTKTKNNI